MLQDSTTKLFTIQLYDPLHVNIFTTNNTVILSDLDQL